MERRSMPGNPANAQDISFAVSPSLADVIRRDAGHDVFELALQVANDVVAFEAHRIFLHVSGHGGKGDSAANGPSEDSALVWEFSSGFFAGEAFQRELDRSWHYFKRLRHENAEVVQIPDTDKLSVSGRWICVLRLTADDGADGYLAVARRKRGKFTDTECYHLKMIVHLIRAGLASLDASEVLRRLHLSFLDQRTLLPELPIKELLDEYLRKAVEVCHAVSGDWLESRSGKAHTDQASPSGVIRLTAKLPTDSLTALEIRACGSTQPHEWTDELKKALYVLPAPQSNTPAESIAARVYQDQRHYYTPDYQNVRQHNRRLFTDSQCHMTAPIVCGRDKCHGVVSIETTLSKAYQPAEVAAFTLLAAHLARPLERARERETDERKRKAFHDTLAEFRHDASEDRLRDQLISGLERLQYQRGLISRVDWNARRVDGQRAWGGAEMERVCFDDTHRKFDKHTEDCQVKVALTAKEIIVYDPENDKHAHKPTVQRGKLKPFAVFPLKDSRNRVLETVHVERLDTAPIGDTDKALIQELCLQMMKAREEGLRNAVERAWFAEMPRTIHSLEEMLRRFADLVADENRGFAVRCRVFLVTSTGEQKPFYQAGRYQAKGFLKAKLDERDTQILGAPKPLLFVRKNATTDLQGGEDFGVRLEQDEAHPADLNNEYRSQWVEVAVWVRERPVAKVVFDHTDVPHDRRTRGRKGYNDAFTLDEVRLIARLGRMLSLAAEFIDARRTYFHLCRLGLLASLFWHYLSRSADELSYAPETAIPPEFQHLVKSMQATLKPFDGLFRNHKDREVHAIGSIEADWTSVDEELVAASHVFTAVKNDNILLNDPPPKGSFPQRVPHTDHPLMLIVLTLLNNARKILARHLKKQRGGIGRIDIKLTRDRTSPACVHIRIKDTGPGLSVKEARQLKDRLKDPALALANGEGSDLVYSAYLARELGWELKLTRARSWTTFDLVVRTQDAGGSS